MLTIPNLLFDDLGNIIDELFSKMRAEVEDPESFDKAFEEKSEAMFNIFDENYTDMFVGLLTKDYLKTWRKKSARNSDKIMDTHETLFLYYFGYLDLAYTVVSNLNKAAVGNSGMEEKDKMIICMYGNLFRMCDEIGTLLTHGFTTGALQLWRSFYEHAVVTIFLIKCNSNELTAKFMDASDKKFNDQVESYNKHRVDLKFPELDQTILKHVEAKQKSMKDIYDKDFFKQDYAWAKDFLPEKPNFREVESSVAMDRYRPYYIWASSYCHPNLRSVTAYRNSEHKIVVEKIIQQKIDKQSFVDPMQLTLAIFEEVNNHLFNKYSPAYEYATNMMMFRKIFKKLSDQFAPEG